MKKNYFLKKFLMLTFLFMGALTLKAQSTGDIAFVAMNADGDDDFAIVVLADISASTTIYFSDDELDGTGSFVDSNEGNLQWVTPASTLTAGTVVIFTDTDNGSNLNFGVSTGTLSYVGSGTVNLSASGDALFAYLGTDQDNPTTFLAGTQIGTLSDFYGDLTGSGLTIGSTFIQWATSGTPDGGKYIGPKFGQSSFSNYLTLLNNTGYWEINSTDGDALLPFSSDSYSIINNTWDGSTDNDWDTASNWSTNAVPTSTSDVSIPNGLTNYPTSSGAITIIGITIESGASFIAQSTVSGSVMQKRNLGTANWYLVSPGVSGQDIDLFASATNLDSGTGSNLGLSSYDNSTPGWVYYQDGASGSGNFTDGSGRAIKLTSSGDISFIGTMNTSDVSVSMTSNSNGFNLVGNPFTSYIAGNSNADGTNNILTVNTSNLTENTLWFWDQSTSSYDQINQASAAFYIAPAQGFFVSSTGSNTFNFTEAMQSHQGTDSFQRTSSDPRPEINLVMTDGSTTRDADIFYIDGTTTGFDNGYDSSIFGGVANEFAIYTHAVANGTGKNLGIQSLPNNDFENMIIPVGINATSGTEITLSAATFNFPAGINVYLEDKDDDSFTLLDSSSDFTTTLSSDLNGIGRFFLHTSSQALSTDEVNFDNVSIYTANSNLRIVGVQSGNAQVRVYNILGRQVMNASFQGNGVNEITLPNVRAGVYIVQLETETGKLNKKVIIE
jgi:hypothetical protein